MGRQRHSRSSPEADSVHRNSAEAVVSHGENSLLDAKPAGISAAKTRVSAAHLSAPGLPGLAYTNDTAKSVTLRPRSRAGTLNTSGVSTILEKLLHPKGASGPTESTWNRKSAANSIISTGKLPSGDGGFPGLRSPRGSRQSSRDISVKSLFGGAFTKDVPNLSITQNALENAPFANREPDNEPELTFDNMLPNFVSKHVRRYVDDLVKNAGLSTRTAKRLFANAIAMQRTTDTLKEETALMEQLNSLIKPVALEAFGAVVMVDVSGYSNLASVLAQRGPVGAEILSRTMKVYLDKIIQIISAHGGDIVKFIGDAVLFYWKLELPESMDDPMTEEELAVEKGEIVLKACDCCLEMLIKLGQFKIDIPGCNIHLLKIHLGIGAGQIFDVHVGGMPGRWEHFIAGDAVHQLANVLDIAKAGELAVSLPALRWFQEVIELGKSDVAYYNKRCILLHGLEKRTRKAYGRLHSDNSMMALWDINGRTSPLAQYLYKMYINENAQFKLQTDLNQTALFRLNSRLNDLMGLNELRQVTTVFIKVGSLRFDSKDSLLETQEAMQAVQRALKRYQGSLRQFHVDDKGAVILVFFGLPPLAHESDASFGIKAGMEICVAFKQIFPDFAIGITTGVVSIGGVGNAVRTEYAVMGDSLNMAARLMCNKKAKASLLCDERTYRLCEKEFVFESIGLVKVKGKDEPIPVYRPTAFQKMVKDTMGSYPNLNNELVGRKKEQETIDSALRAYEAGSNVTLVLEAEQGQGLTSLVRYLRRKAADSAMQLSGGKGSELEKDTEFFIYQEVVTDVFRLLDNANLGKDGKTQLSKAALDARTKSSDSLLDAETGSMDSGRGESAMAPRGLHPDSPTQPKASEPLPPLPTLRLPSALVQEIKMYKSRRDLGSAEVAQAEEKQTVEDLLRRGISLIGEPASKIRCFESVYPQGLGMDSDMVTGSSGVPPSPTNEEDAASAAAKKREFMELFIKIVNYVTDRAKLVFILHGLQFMEPLSWDLTMELIANCPGAMFCLATRPARQYPALTGEMLRMLRKRPSTMYVTVSSMSEEEIGVLIQRLWKRSVLSSVQPSIVRAIWMQSGGSPQYAKSLIAGFEDGDQWVVTNEGHLTQKDRYGGALLLSPRPDIQSVIIAQFDRLDQSFQILLRIASVIGVTFSLNDVLRFLPAPPSRETNYPVFSGTSPWEDTGIEFCTGMEVFGSQEDVNKMGDIGKNAADGGGKAAAAVPDRPLREQTAQEARPTSDTKNGKAAAPSDRPRAEPPVSAGSKSASASESTKPPLPPKAKGCSAKRNHDKGVRCDSPLPQRKESCSLYQTTTALGMLFNAPRSQNPESLPRLSKIMDEGRAISRSVSFPGPGLDTTKAGPAMAVSGEDVSRALGKTVDDIVNDLHPANASLAEIIEKMDIFNFLTPCPGSSDGDRAFTFRMPLVRECIYTTMLSTQRQQLHLAVATYYEHLLMEEKKPPEAVLVLIYEHFSQTDDAQWYKKIWYLECVADFYARTNESVNAIRHYTLLTDMIDMLGRRTPPLYYDTVRRSRWYRHLGSAYFNQQKLPEAEQHFIRALQLVGYTMPRSKLARWAFERRLKLYEFVQRLFRRRPKKGLVRRPTGARPKIGAEVQEILARNRSIYTAARADESGELLSMDFVPPLRRGSRCSAASQKSAVEHNDFTGLRFCWDCIPNERLAYDAFKARENCRSKITVDALRSRRLALLCTVELYLQLRCTEESRLAIWAALHLSEKLPEDDIDCAIQSTAAIVCWLNNDPDYEVKRYLLLSLEKLKNVLHGAAQPIVSSVLENALFYDFMRGSWDTLGQDLAELRRHARANKDFALVERLTRMEIYSRLQSGKQSRAYQLAAELRESVAKSERPGSRFWATYHVLAVSIFNASRRGDELEEMQQALAAHYDKIVFSGKFGTPQEEHFVVAYHTMQTAVDIVRNKYGRLHQFLQLGLPSMTETHRLEWETQVGLFTFSRALFTAIAFGARLDAAPQSHENTEGMSRVSHVMKKALGVPLSAKGPDGTTGRRPSMIAAAAAGLVRRLSARSSGQPTAFQEKAAAMCQQVLGILERSSHISCHAKQLSSIYQGLIKLILENPADAVQAWEALLATPSMNSGHFDCTRRFVNYMIKTVNSSSKAAPSNPCTLASARASP